MFGIRFGGLLAVVLVGAAPALGQTTSPWAGRTNQSAGGFGVVGSTGTSTTNGTTSGTATTPVTADDLLMTQFAEVLVMADALAAELGIEFQNPWEELFFILVVAEMRAKLQQQQSGTRGFGGGFGRRGGAVGGGFGGSSGGRSRGAPGGFDPRPTNGSGTTTGGTTPRQ